MSDPAANGGRGSIRRRRRLRFQDLMRHRVHRILLVSSLYDSFILAEDGKLSQTVLTQFVDLNLSTTPDLTRVSTGAEALELVDGVTRFDLIITSLQVGDMSALDLARAVKQRGVDAPVVLLAYNNRELTDFRARHDLSVLDRVFLWQGDVSILLAIVKYVEDRLNVPHDTGEAGVPAIIVVEDNVRFYSSFLPVIYTELVDHTQGLIAEGLNLYQKTLRMRVRPKILLCETYEEAWHYFSTYEEHILGLISDIEFPKDGELHRRAGVELASRVREIRPEIPIMLQSSFPQNEDLANSVGAAFLLKGSPLLLHQLRRFIVDNFGFGDFVFHMPDGEEITRARDLKTLVQKLQSVPAEALAYHGERNHFSNWLKARGEFSLADRLRPRKVSDFPTLEDLRQDLITSIGKYRRERDRVVVADFNRKRLDAVCSISRIGGGSLGGKARGLAFVNRLLSEYEIAERFPEVEVSVPISVVLGTDIFDQFLEQNDLEDFAIRSTSDAEIEKRFLGARFPAEAQTDLETFLEVSLYPLAVRSSGLLEDSPSQPFAGIYQTYMLPNNDRDPKVRLRQLLAAVKRVYASTFSQQSKNFLKMTRFRLEEEKMAVIIQKVVGRGHGDRFYPDFSGVARSQNVYPTAPMKAEDGIAAVALGLGRTVVDGDACLRFCPKYPRHLPAFSSVDDALKNSQREFYALCLASSCTETGTLEGELCRYDLQAAEEDTVLASLGSTYSLENDVIYDGVSRAGVRLITFAPILKHGRFPLADLLNALLEIGSEGTSSPVEIEFAVNAGSSRHPPEFGFLQMRPVNLAGEMEKLEIGHVRSSEVLCRSASVLGHGKIELRDVVVVDSHRFDRSKSREVAQQVGRYNAPLQKGGTPYLLVGVGRWGSADPYLGIPVSWDQISGARVIVEAGFRDFKVTPSQGTHFFQNLTSCGVGYFTVNPQVGEGFVDWEWLARQAARAETDFVRHLHLDEPLTVKMSGQTGEGVILKPGGTS